MAFSKPCRALLKQALKKARDKTLSRKIKEATKEKQAIEDKGQLTALQQDDALKLGADIQQFNKDIEKPISEGEVDRHFKRLNEIYKDQIDDPAKVERVLQDYEISIRDFVRLSAEKRKISIQNKQKQQIKEIEINRTFDSYMSRFKDKDAEEAIVGYLAGTNIVRTGARDSIDAHQKALGNRWIGGFGQELEDLKVLHRLEKADSSFRREIMRGLYAVNDAATSGISKADVIAKIDPDAITIARTIYKWQNMGVNRMRRNGMVIENHPSYMFRTAHDQKILNDIGLNKWRARIRTLLHDKSFHGRSEVEVNDFLNNLYHDLRSGSYTKVDPNESNLDLDNFDPDALGTSSKVSRRNRLVFKNAEAHMDYLEEFGRGSGDILDSVIFGFEHNARALGLNDRLGQNPEAMLRKLVKKTKENLGDDARATFRVNSKGFTNKISNVFAELDGTTRSASNVSVAHFFSVARQIKSTALLGAAVLRSVNDLAFTLAEARFQGIPLHKYIDNIVRNHFSSVNDGVTKRVTRSMGIGLQGFTGDLISRFSSDDSLSGKAFKMQKVFFKYSGLTGWTDGLKKMSGRMMSNNIAQQSATRLSKLDSKTQRLFKLFDITERDWDLWRKSVYKEVNGEEFLTPDSLQRLDHDTLIDHFGLEDSTVIGKKLDELEDKLSSMFIDRNDFFVPMPGAREQAFWHQGTERGTAIGEMMRMFGQFKTFPLTVFNRSFVRDFRAGDNVGMAYFMAQMTMLGYIGNSLIDVSNGKVPRDITDKDEIADITLQAMIQGGTFGLWSDFLLAPFSDSHHFDLLSQAAGPIPSSIANIGDVVSSAKDGNVNMRRVLNIAKSWTPFSNVFYGRLAMNHLVFYNLQEIADPGYLSRLERGTKANQGQDFFAQPTKSVPFGGRGFFEQLSLP